MIQHKFNADGKNKHVFGVAVPIVRIYKGASIFISNVALLLMSFWCASRNIPYKGFKLHQRKTTLFLVV